MKIDPTKPPKAITHRQALEGLRLLAAVKTPNPDLMTHLEDRRQYEVWLTHFGEALFTLAARVLDPKTQADKN